MYYCISPYGTTTLVKIFKNGFIKFKQDDREQKQLDIWFFQFL